MENFSTMASEDMAECLDRVPGCYFFVGCGNISKKITAPHHTSEFDLDEDALLLGAEIIAATILNNELPQNFLQKAANARNVPS